MNNIFHHCFIILRKSYDKNTSVWGRYGFSLLDTQFFVTDVIAIFVMSSL